MTGLVEKIGHFLSPNWDFEYACCREAILFTDALYGIFLLVDSLIFLLYIHLFARNKIVHVNFRVILIILAVNDMILVYHRLADFWLTGKIDRENGFTYFIKMNCWARLIFSLLNVIGERSFSLYAYKWYHDAYWKYPTHMVVIYIIEEAISGILIWKRVISKRLIVDCFAVVIVLTAVFLIVIYRSSRRRHRQMIAMRFQWSDDSLSRRHRTMSILRENHLLQIFLPFLLVSSLLQMLEASAILHFIVPIDHRYYLVAHCVFYLTISIRVLFDLLIPILAHPVIKTDAKKTIRSLIKRFHRHRQVISEGTPVHSPRIPLSNVRATNGHKLSFSPEEEKETVECSSSSSSSGISCKTSGFDAIQTSHAILVGMMT